MLVLEGSVSQPLSTFFRMLVPSKRIRKRSRMRRNLLLISCNLMLLDPERAADPVDVQRNEKEFLIVESRRMHIRLILYGMRLNYVRCISNKDYTI